MDLIAKIPEIVCYAYRTKVHYFDSDSLFIHPVNTEYSIAENILQMLRIDRSFTKIEASVLDMCLVLHADHGGGTTRLLQMLLCLQQEQTYILVLQELLVH